MQRFIPWLIVVLVVAGHGGQCLTGGSAVNGGSGRATLEVEGDDLPAKPGSLLFVKAHAEHRFHAIEEDLTVLVFFSEAKPEER